MKLTKEEKAKRLTEAYEQGRKWIAGRPDAPQYPFHAPGDNNSTPPPKLPVPSQSSADDLTKLRDSCVALFSRKPLKIIPPISIHSDDHFTVIGIIPDPNFAPPLPNAHYEPSRNIVCFREGYLKTATAGQLVNTMKHELLHAWIHQHDFSGDRAHDDIFKAACELLGIQWWEGYRAT